MKANGLRARCTEKESIAGRMERSMLDNLKMI